MSFQPDLADTKALLLCWWKHAQLRLAFKLNSALRHVCEQSATLACATASPWQQQRRFVTSMTRPRARCAFKQMPCTPCTANEIHLLQPLTAVFEAHGHAASLPAAHVRSKHGTDRGPSGGSLHVVTSAQCEQQNGHGLSRTKQQPQPNHNEVAGYLHPVATAIAVTSTTLLAFTIPFIIPGI